MRELKGSMKLKAAMKDIEKVLAKYDVGGPVVLCDGEGMSEFRFFFDTPTWSNMRFLPSKSGGMAVHTKLYNKSQKERTAKTVNLLYGVENALLKNLQLMNLIKTEWARHIEVEVLKEEP